MVALVMTAVGASSRFQSRSSSTSPTSMGATRSTGPWSGPSTQAIWLAGSSRISFTSSSRWAAAFCARDRRAWGPASAAPASAPGAPPLPRPALRISSRARLTRSRTTTRASETSSGRGRGKAWSRCGRNAPPSTAAPSSSATTTEDCATKGRAKRARATSRAWLRSKPSAAEAMSSSSWASSKTTRSWSGSNSASWMAREVA